MPRFPYYSSVNSYIEPYSSAKDGGELVTEFNQRAPINVVGWKLIDLTGSGIWFDPAKKQSSLEPGQYYSWMSGTRDEDSLKLSIVNSNMRVAPGEALVCGYYGDFLQELLIPTDEIISISEMGTNKPDDYVLTRYVKLQVVTTESQNNRHDERLVPPLGDQYLGIEIIVDDALPQLNQLLLGTISRDVNGRFAVVNNPWKSRFISIKHIAGAENYDNLIVAPDDNSIYGVLKGGKDGKNESDPDSKITNLFNINQWTWLPYNSVLGKFLRNLAKEPDDTGKPGGIPGSDDVEMLGTLVGWATNPSANKLIRLELNDHEAGGDIAKPYLTYRVLTQGEKQADCYQIEKVRLPFASYSRHTIPDDVPPTSGSGRLSSRVSGMMTPETLWQIDQLWSDRDSMNTGRQFGPFLNRNEASNWLSSHTLTKEQFATASAQDKENKLQLQKGDYYWVLSDTVENDANPGNLSVDYGTVSGTYTATTNGEVTASFGSIDLSGSTIDATATGTARSGSTEISFVSDDVEITPTSSLPVSSVSGTATGTGTGTAVTKLTNFVQNVSARYVYLPDKDDSNYPDGRYIWCKQAVLRGYASPATPQNYGFVRPSDGTSIGDVINDTAKNQLRLDDVGLQLLKNGGWKYSTDTAIELTPDNEAKFAELESTWFLSDSVTIVLKGTDWDSSSLPSIHRLRGNIVLDFSNATLGSGATSLVLCEDVNIMTLNPGNNAAKIDTKDCVITTHYFNSINHWQNTVFDSGSNIALVNNPWMTVSNAFSTDYENALQVRFVSVTRGEYGVESAEMDIWIKREDWTKPGSYENLAMTTIKKLKFPPLLLRLDESGNVSERQDIDDSLNAKVSGTGGTHRSWDDRNSRYVMTGNWISTIDWENGEELSLNGRLLSPTPDKLHGLYDVRFRALVQFTKSDDMMEESVDYSIIYQ